MWGKLILYGIGVAAVLGVLLTINYWRLEAAKVPLRDATIKILAKQLIGERAQKKEGEKLTQTVNQNYENAKRDLTNARRRLRVTEAASCVPVQPTTGTNLSSATTPGTKPMGAHGISSEWLLDYGEEAEGYRIQLKACQDFVNKLYKANQ